MAIQILPRSFYLEEDVLGISQALLGKVLVSNIQGQVTAGMIVETEAYRGIEDKASHAYNNRRTARTETMYLQGGVAYIYLCYGLHHLFNVVTAPEGIPHAVLTGSRVGIDYAKAHRDLPWRFRLKNNIWTSKG